MGLGMAESATNRASDTRKARKSHARAGHREQYESGFSGFAADGSAPPKVPLGNRPRRGIQFEIDMAKPKEQIFEVACPDCGAMLRIDAKTGALVSHTSAPRKRMFEDLETAAKAMRDQDERKESIFRQSVEAEKNKEDLFEKKFAEALRKAKDAPEGKPLREFDLD
jgi:hypothetical protein